MRREQLEHVLRAASTIVGERDVLVIGSQAILGSIPDAALPIEATTSIEADLAFFDDPADAKADRVDGAIGELSPFHETYSYYAQGVSVSTAILPAGWRERLVGLDTPDTEPGRGLCLEPHDCVVSKLVAGRWKERDFAGALLREHLIDPMFSSNASASLACPRTRSRDCSHGWAFIGDLVENGAWWGA